MRGQTSLTLQQLAQVAIARSKQAGLSGLFIIFRLGDQQEDNCQEVKQTIEKTFDLSCMILDPRDVTVNSLRSLNPSGIIIADGEVDIWAPKTPVFNYELLDFAIENEIHVLGYGLGADIIVKYSGGSLQFKIQSVSKSAVTLAAVNTMSTLLTGCNSSSHVQTLDNSAFNLEKSDLKETAQASDTEYPMALESEYLHALLFDLNSNYTLCRDIILSNFVYRLCLEINFKQIAAC